MALNKIISEGIKDSEVKLADMADDSVGVTELSATGTASSSTFLRGDNAWATPTDTNTQLTEEQVEDYVGGMVTGNTETGITVTYEDSDGTLDFVVAPEGTSVVSTGESGGTKFLREDGDGTCSWQTVNTTPEGTAILSTGETGGTKFLREDGDNSCSWQTVSAVIQTTAGTDNFTVADGNLIIGTAGHGVDFSATGSGSGTMSKELFDFYEEGTWEPEMWGNVKFTMTGTHGAQDGLYTRVGNVVTAYFRLGWQDQNSASGSLSIRNWPFMPKSTPSGYYYSGVFLDFWGEFASGDRLLQMPGGENKAYIQSATAASLAAVSDLGGGNGGFSGSITYLCND